MGREKAEGEEEKEASCHSYRRGLQGSPVGDRGPRRENQETGELREERMEGSMLCFYSIGAGAGSRVAGIGRCGSRQGQGYGARKRLVDRLSGNKTGCRIKEPET